MHAEVDGDVEDLGTVREVHAEEDDVTPRAVGEVHADGRLFAEDGVGAVGGITFEEGGPEPERLVQRVAHAEHPLIAFDGADAAADLVC